MEPLPIIKNRVVGRKYIHNNIIRIWDGKKLRCEHNRETPSRCKDCDGKDICEHKRRRSHCKQCGGNQICKHQRQKSQCMDCKGKGICEHKRRRANCKECHGGNICNHQRQRSQCKYCGGKNICQHKIQRSHCKICKGSNICKHNKRKERCKECGGSELCKSPWCDLQIRNNKYDGYCLACFVNNPENYNKPVVRNYKTKELHVKNYIQESFPNHNWIYDKKIEDGCSKRRPDLMIDLLTHVIIVEIDEEQHNNYDSLCENMRVMQISQDNAHRPSVFIRFNPDSYTRYGQKVPSCFTVNKLGICVISNKQVTQWKERLEVLKEEIKKWMNIDICILKTIQQVYLFYNK